MSTLGPQHYSLGMLLTGRGWHDGPTLSAMDLLALAIADEEQPPHPLIVNLFRPGDGVAAPGGQR